VKEGKGRKKDGVFQCVVLRVCGKEIPENQIKI
jgi:hypothetical protein